MNKILFGLFLLVSNYALAKTIQMSWVERPGVASPFAGAIHFRYEAEVKTAWIAGNSRYGGFRWAKRTISDADAKKIDKAVKALRVDQREKNEADTLTDEFHVAVGDHTTEWKGYRDAQGGGRSARVTRFLEGLIADDDKTAVHFSPFDGDVSFKMSCDYVASRGVLNVLTVNNGTTATRLKPVADHLADYWGYPPLNKGQAASAQALPARKEMWLQWELDLDAFKKSEPRTQLLYLAEGLIETDLPEAMTPQYQSIHRCDMPGKLKPGSFADFDAKSPAASLTPLEGIWLFSDTELVGEKFYLILENGKTTYLGAENFGEHGVAYFSTPIAEVNFNEKNQVRFSVGSVKYYEKAFSPSRRTPAKNEESRGAGKIGYRLEGVATGDTLALRCVGRDEECPAALLQFKRLKK